MTEISTNWLKLQIEPRELIAIARVQNSLDFRAGFLSYLERLKTELSTLSAHVKDDVEIRLNQGRLQAIIDLLTLCKNAHGWALKDQAKNK